MLRPMLDTPLFIATKTNTARRVTGLLAPLPARSCIPVRSKKESGTAHRMVYLALIGQNYDYETLSQGDSVRMITFLPPFAI